jgi:hypothetical protein
MNQENKPLKSFYDVLWEMCEQEGLITDWINQDYLIKSGNTYSWSPKAIEQFELTCNTSFENQSSNQVSLKKKDEFKKTKETLPSDFNDNKLAEFIQMFSKANIGLSGKMTPKINVVKKFIKFFEMYDYTMDEVLKGTELYITNLKKTGSIQYIRECGYFILKKIDGMDHSDLAKWCEEYRSGGKSYTSHNII